MLASSFIHVPGVGPKAERTLWDAGARDWDAFLAMHEAGTLSGARMRRLAPAVLESRQALDRGQIEFFTKRLPARELWRLYEPFRQHAAYLDIETTGLSPGLDVVTAIGLADGDSVRTFVRGRNLDEFPHAAATYPLLVTFNGATFDVPFLQTTFPRFVPRAHLDLRYPLARLGYRGGLKQIERDVGIRRPRHLAELSGFDAVLLWRRHEKGEPGALETLLAYLHEDVRNLRTLADLVSSELPRELGHPRG